MPENISNWQDAIVVAGSSVLNQLAIFIPNLLGAILVLVIGWLAGAWLKILVAKILGAVRLNALITGTAVDSFLKKAEIRGKIEDILGSTVRWLTIFIFFIAAINILGLSTVSQVLNNILGYIPKVFSAAIVLLAGVLFSRISREFGKRRGRISRCFSFQIFRKISKLDRDDLCNASCNFRIGNCRQFYQYPNHRNHRHAFAGTGIGLGTGE